MEFIKRCSTRLLPKTKRVSTIWSALWKRYIKLPSKVPFLSRVGLGVGVFGLILPFWENDEERDLEKLRAVFRRIVEDSVNGYEVQRTKKSESYSNFLKDVPEIQRFPDKPEPDVTHIYEIISGKKALEPTKFQKLRQTPEYMNMIRHVNGAGWSYHPWFPKDRTLIDSLYNMVKDEDTISQFIRQGMLPARVPSPYGKPITLYFDSRVLIHDLNVREGSKQFFERAALRWEVVVFYKESWIQEIIDPVEDTATYSIYAETYPELPTLGFKSLALLNRPPESTVQLEGKAEHGLFNPNNVLVVSPPTLNETTMEDLDNLITWMSDKIVDEKVPAYKIIPHFHSIDKDAPTVFKEKSKIPGFLESIK